MERKRDIHVVGALAAGVLALSLGVAAEIAVVMPQSGARSEQEGQAAVERAGVGGCLSCLQEAARRLTNAGGQAACVSLCELMVADEPVFVAVEPAWCGASRGILNQHRFIDLPPPMASV